MRRRVALMAAVSLVSLATPFSAQQADPVQAAMTALGTSALNSVRITGFGASYSVGQSPNPKEPWPRVTVKSYDAQIDYARPAMRVEIAREQGPITPRGGAPTFAGEQRVIQIVNGNDAWDVPPPARGAAPAAPAPPATPAAADPPATQAPATPAPATTPSAPPQPQPAQVVERQLQIWLTPHGFLKGAVANHATTKAVAGGSEVTFTTPSGHRLVGFISSRNQVERVQTWIDNPVLGDMPLEVTYRDYELVSGVQYPMHILQRQGGFPSLELWLSSTQANPTVDVPLPDTVRGATVPPVRVESAKLADGVYYLTGGSHHSVAVEMRDHVVVIEAPLNEARSLAVIAKAKELMPGKPIRFVVNTHHHFDHAGGLRTFVDEGATVVTHEGNRAFLTTAWAAPRTLGRDRLAASAKMPTFKTVVDKDVLTDGKRTIEIHRLASSLHADGFLVAYLPAEKILIEADAYTPAAVAQATAPAAGAAGTTPGPPSPPVSPAAINLYDNIRRLKLDVSTIAALHGPRVATLDDLTRAVGRTGTN